MSGDLHKMPVSGSSEFIFCGSRTCQVVTEVERNITRKAPKALTFTREVILRANIRILRDPQIEEDRQHQDWISHSAEIPILVAAACARVDFLATLNTRHFIDDPSKHQHLDMLSGILLQIRECNTKTVLSPGNRPPSVGGFPAG